MPEDRLIRELAETADLVFPDSPELVSSVMAGLPSERESRRRLVAAVAVAAVVVTALLVLPAPREAIARLLGIGGVVVEHVDQIDLPEAVPTSVSLGRQVSLAEAMEMISFRLPAIDGLGDPQVFARDDLAGGLVTVVYSDDGEGPGLVITYFGAAREAAVKQIADEVELEDVVIASGVGGLWIEGEHTIVFVGEEGQFVADSARLVANTLIFEQDGTTTRIETLLPLGEAIKIAQSMLP